MRVKEGDKIKPESVFNYISKLHKSGWERSNYDDREWVLSHKYFVLKRIKLNDSSIKWSKGNHPPIYHKYAKLKTDFPPIVIGSNGYIMDGTHRVSAAKLRGDEEIDALIGIT